ncbi:lactate utilization protein [Brevibacillus choshinensis]|uniref:LutC/YkgG family protein n=1 Tax=Brevibacillus choshinensis TaxID=54911 RepID=UPI002E218A53|nr:lactate utilization protein [Brevibacillus choshinensis]
MSDQQQAFIQMISNRLGRPMPSETPRHPFKGAPDFWKTYELDLEQRIDLFRDNWTKAGGHSFRFSTMDDVKRFIVEQAHSLQARQVVQQNQPELLALRLKEHLPSCKVATWSPGNRDELVATAASADIGISMVDQAVAHTGSIVVTSSGNTGRSVSLLPTVFLAIIPVDRLKTRLGEALATYDGRPRKHFPAGIHFISGPSRSADIENDLTIGVHGPGVVFALLVG